MKTTRRVFVKGILGMLFGMAAISGRDILASEEVTDIVCRDGRIVLLTDRGNISYSDDLGGTYYTVNGPPTEHKVNAIAASNADAWVVGCADGSLWGTRDAGATWENVEYYLNGYELPAMRI